MVSPYLETKNRGYPGNQNHGTALGSVTWVTGIGFASTSDSNMHILQPKENILSGQGKMRDERMKKNQGFNL